MAELKPRVLVLGAGGMLGHVVACYFDAIQPGTHLFQARKPTGVPRIDARLTVLNISHQEKVRDWLQRLDPVVIINCIGVKPIQGICAPQMEQINTRFPAFVAELLDRKNDGSRLIQISSDGVFSGRSGAYTEHDSADATDPYGLSKFRGEVSHGAHLTIRTSFIGHELSSTTGLLDWFLHTREPVKGFIKAFWSGITTLELARFTEYAVANEIKGLVHLGGSRLSKYDLLQSICSVYEKTIPLIPSGEGALDRSLRSVRKDIQFDVPEISTMLHRYRDWYKNHVIRGL